MYLLYVYLFILITYKTNTCIITPLYEIKVIPKKDNSNNIRSKKKK